MKEQFVEKRFGAEAMQTISICDQILTDYSSRGYDLSVRQLYYQLVSSNYISNNERSYKNLTTLVSDARMAGYLDWEAIVDRGRELVSPSTFKNLTDFMWVVKRGYRLDKWQNQKVSVEVMVEKQALEGVLIPVCRRLGIGFTANKGYSSSTAVYECSKRILRRITEGQKAVVIYLGDHDPSGIDMTRDVRDRLTIMCAPYMNEDVSVWEELLVVHRIALNRDQVDQYSLPPNPAKITDSRASAYIQRFGNESWELDAMRPEEIAALVEQTVMQYVDIKSWRSDEKSEEKDKEKINNFIKKLK